MTLISNQMQGTSIQNRRHILFWPELVQRKDNLNTWEKRKDIVEGVH